jgi:ribosome-binding factor A
MPEDRAKRYHQERIAETVREEIDAMILGDLSDPRISSAHVTQVLLNPGGKSAEVYVELKTRMGKRHVPELVFHVDRSERMTGRIDELLTRTRKRNKYPSEPQATTSAQPKPQNEADSN